MLEQAFMLSPMVLMLDKLFRRRQVDRFDFKFYYELDLRECVHSFSLAINSLLWENGLWSKLLSCTSLPRQSFWR